MSSPLKFALRGLLLAVNPANEMFDTWGGSSMYFEIVRLGEVGKLLVFNYLIDVVRPVESHFRFEISQRRQMFQTRDFKMKLNVDSLQAVKDLVDRLHRLSALIRKSAV
jgi:hypothetical protein